MGGGAGRGCVVLVGRRVTVTFGRTGAGFGADFTRGAVRWMLAFAVTVTVGAGSGVIVTVTVGAGSGVAVTVTVGAGLGVLAAVVVVLEPSAPPAPPRRTPSTRP